MMWIPFIPIGGGHYYGNRFTDELVKFITNIDPEAAPILYGQKMEIDGALQSKYLSDLYKDMAWAAQELLEQAAVMLAKKLLKDYHQDNLCVAGGVALNCKMNGELLRQSGCTNIFIQPASSDAGTALGAAMVVSQQLGENIRNPLKNTYMGPEYTNQEIESILRRCKVSYRHSGDPATEAAHYLEQGKIVGWFQGRMEFGPRALGNQSILVNPIYPDIKDKVNIEVKYRESWRPFCPSMLDKVKDRYIENANEASFMTVAYHMPEAMQKYVPSCVHVDGTIRPQVVTLESNPLYYDLISKLGERTGHPIVMNTSFNVRGEPMVCNPPEAIRCYCSNGLDSLFIGNCILEKK